MKKSDIHKCSCLGNQKNVKPLGHHYNHLFHTLKIKRFNTNKTFDLENKSFKQNVAAYGAIFA
jgi:hypothetical protein